MRGVISYMTLKTARFPLPLISRASSQRGVGAGGKWGDIGNYVSKVNEIRRKLSPCE